MSFTVHTLCIFFFFFFNDTATTEIYTLSLHDALPIYPFFDKGLPSNVEAERSILGAILLDNAVCNQAIELLRRDDFLDRKSTRLNSSHSQISYAVFCLKKKKVSRPGPLPPIPMLDLLT